MTRTLTVAAPAKINLDLRVAGLRPDGYHELRTLFQSIGLHDTVTLTLRRGPFTVRSRSPRVPRDQNNIAWHAAQVLWTALGRAGLPDGVAVSIKKRIPMCGGLGGGSSDAAAVLRGLTVLWDVPRGRPALRALAARVGADVPFLLAGGLQRGTGRGDCLRRLRDLPPLWVVLAVPPFGVSTPDAYRWFDEHRLGANSEPHRLGANSEPHRRWRVRLGSLRNDLESPVAARFPDIGRVTARLRALGAAHAAMTGSGSTVFGLFRVSESARIARRKLRLAGWRTGITCTVGHLDFTRLTGVGAVSDIDRVDSRC